MDRNGQYVHAKNEAEFYVVCQCKIKFLDYQEYNDHKWDCDAYKKALVRVKSEENKQKPKINFIYKNMQPQKSQTTCKICKAEVNTKNMSRHLLDFHQKKTFKKESEFVPLHPPSKKQNKKEEEEKIQCYLCGVMMSLDEVSRHAEKCAANMDICHHCSMKFPKDLIDDHMFACEDQKREEYRMLYNSKILEELILEQERTKREVVIPQEEDKVNKGLSKSKIKQLPQSEYISKKDNEGQREEQECIICYGEFEERSKIIRLPCLHIFHPICIKNWVPLDKRCPTCKMIIKWN